MAEQAAKTSATSAFGSGTFSTPISTNAATNIPHSASNILNSLKRARSDARRSPSPPTNSSFYSKSPRYDINYSLAPLTGAAALADERRRQKDQRPTSVMSENPGHKVLSSLVAGGGTAMSKPSDAPPATTALSTPMSTVAQSIVIPKSPMSLQEMTETSPASVTSLASLGSTAQTATASTTAAASPSNTDAPRHREAADSQPKAEGVSSNQNTSYSYSGQAVTLSAGTRGPPPRGMSTPMAGLSQGQGTPRSPSAQKKHKCPYCDTEFTRHHNLKSHLLTHSQEKPYVCQTCQMRFRRLHDLKRHSKLHTGERPHVCPKCDRKFARGDALARHAKGQGGCAGRRASMGSYGEGGDDDYEGSQGAGSGMEGVVYAEPEQTNEIPDEDSRRLSLPSIKTQHVQRHSQDSSYSSQSRMPSTYPPAGPRPRANTGNSLYPPGQEPGASSSISSVSQGNLTGGGGHSANTSISTMHSPGGYAPGGMTESPKPLSPSAMNSYQLGHDSSSINRQRSPSLTTQFQHQHFGRRDSSRTSPQVNLPSPHSQGPKLPSLTGLAPPGLAPPMNAYPLSSPVTLHPPSLSQGSSSYQPQMSSGGPVNPIRSIIPLGHQPSNNREGGNNLFASDTNLWPYVQSLEAQVRQLTDRVLALEVSERNSQERIHQLQQEMLASRVHPSHQSIQPHQSHPPHHGHQQ